MNEVKKFPEIRKCQINKDSTYGDSKIELK